MSLSPQRVDFELYWGRLSSKISKIVQLQGITGMEMFSDIYKLCTAQPHPYSEKLYQNLKAFLEEHVNKLFNELEFYDGYETLLIEYLKRWEAYSTGSEYNHALFRYLNSNWIKKKMEESRNKLGNLYHSSGSVTSEVHDVLTLSLIIWKENLFNKIKGRLLKAVLALINTERSGEQVNQSKIQSVMHSFVKLGIIHKHKPLEIYQYDYEKTVLQATHDYYKSEASSFISEHGVSSYMIKVFNRIEEETLRGQKYLDTSSAPLLQNVLNKVLIQDHMTILQNQCQIYLKHDGLEDLKRMYLLFKRIESGIQPMLEVFEQHVIESGFSAVENMNQKEMKEPKIFVETILNVHRHYSKVVQTAFNNDVGFNSSLDKSFKTIINENSISKKVPSHSPEMVAKYSDVLLKKSTKNLEENELEIQINNTLTAFKFIADKDVFQKFYSKLLARRLIQNLSVSEHSESQMIAGLKNICGFEYTSKLQRMFTDIGLSSEINEKLKEYLSETTKPPFDFSVMVLTAGSWPLQTQSSNILLPTDLSQSLNIFQTFYNIQRQGRKLTWLHHLSKGEVRSFCFKKKYEFQLSAYQMAVLLCFNDNAMVSLNDLTQITNLKEGELSRTVASLVDAKLLIVQEDVHKINPEFANKRLKLKLAGVLQKETPQENKAIHKAIDEDRKLYLQAAIVRVMKSRRELDHVNLVQEVIDLTKSWFLPNVPMIKKCIESLIEKEYIRRLQGNTNRYQYIS